MLVFKCAPAVEGLSILETERKLVSAEVWTKLRAYFPKAPEFTQNQEPCQQCLVSRQLQTIQCWNTLILHLSFFISFFVCTGVQQIGIFGPMLISL